MTNTIPYKNIDIHYALSGKGQAVVLLHGFLENKEMWQFAHDEFSQSHQIISIDLLGHGKTECLSSNHRMEEMAHAVKVVCNHLKIEKVSIIGHSMGGYVALELAKNYPDLVSAICLMNSNYYADDEDKKILRRRANEMAKTQFQSLVRMSFVNLFAPSSTTTFKNEIDSVLNQALQTPIDGYIKGQEGMINRNDYSDFFAKLSISKMVILGKKDPVMPADPIEAFCKINAIPIKVLPNGHMSHIEDKNSLIEVLKTFLV
ncbi:alpha/beta fold hydrolase [Spongiivirga citrea]|uniref:Alpha/beta fold hydrolase n=1 Tax=Spongiivirga citrea TaxID=1481457 RepID=A0A6M0CJ72_9FLAO|nr:alpha/beta hydrolase [Spongiivirga citrea]NER17033.1 alpha/beta fold hydrolase [Spongiivirga citrea]